MQKLGEIADTSQGTGSKRKLYWHDALQTRGWDEPGEQRCGSRADRIRDFPGHCLTFIPLVPTPYSPENISYATTPRCLRQWYRVVYTTSLS